MSDVLPGKVPILESAGVGFSYLKTHWAKWLPAIGILSLIAGWHEWRVLGSTSLNFVSIGTFCVWQLVNIMMVAGVYRDALRKEFAAPLGLTFGRDEVNLVGVFLCFFLIFGVSGFFVAFILTAALFGLVANAGLDPSLADSNPEEFSRQLVEAMGSAGGLLVLLIGITVLFAFLFTLIRLTLAHVATVARGRILIFQTWAWTKGNFWRIFATLLLIGLPIGLIGGIVSSVLNSIILSGAAEGGQSAIVLIIAGAVAHFPEGIALVAWTATTAHLYVGLQQSDDENSEGPIALD